MLATLHDAQSFCCTIMHAGHRVELEGVEGKADVSVSVATENRSKGYREIALLKMADLT